MTSKNASTSRITITMPMVFADVAERVVGGLVAMTVMSRAFPDTWCPDRASYDSLMQSMDELKRVLNRCLDIGFSRCCGRG